MPDLRDWILQQIEAAEKAARFAGDWGTSWHYDDWSMRIRTSDGDEMPGEVVASAFYAYAKHIVGNDPATILRRCAADRKILDIHSYAGGICEPYACAGCGHDDMGYLVDHCNDCETLQALAEGYGLTDDERAQLDRPERPKPEPGTRPAWDVIGKSIDDLLRPIMPTSAVPAALRGPNWKDRP
ncbi:DUF6221 family protein [Streptomyces sp. NPDC059385]|uniref:DUF6221 family protein n=1 Tax=Streptomyces sp. NPDC059385 TaxID=3346817 RepID=UPI0036A98B25